MDITAPDADEQIGDRIAPEKASGSPERHGDYGRVGDPSRVAEIRAPVLQPRRTTGSAVETSAGDFAILGSR